jgi:AcrR family transcriptional regulator
MTTTAGKGDRETRRKYAPRLPPAERREQILDAALHLIAENGYGAATMEGVARATGVAKPVVYDLFPGRGELLRALLEREERRALQQLEVVLSAGPDGVDPDEVMREKARRFFDAVLANPDRWRLILLPVEGTPQVVRAYVERGRRWLLAQIQQLLAGGLESRGGPPLDPELGARALLALGEGGAQLVLTEPTRYPPDRLVTFLDTTLRALARS